MSSSALPEYLYHGTRAVHLASILENDLQPRSVSGISQWQHTVESRPDAVYLTTAYPLHFAANAQAAGDLLLLEIATVMLDPLRLIADEDALAHSPDEALPRNLSLEERTRYYREHSQDYSPAKSLATLGTCAHLGPISRRAIRRIARVRLEDLGPLIFGGFDPVVSPINYLLFGAEYEASVRWLFGDTPVCAINPRLARPPLEITYVTAA